MSPGQNNKVDLFLGREMQEAEMHEVAGGWAAVYSAPCPGRETPNEDAAALIPMGPDSAVLIVADGLGGIPGGDQASGLAVGALKSTLRDAAGDDTELRGAILDGIENANNAVKSLGFGAATTLVIVEIQKDMVRPYHVGDSAVLAFGQRGKIKLQTVPHSPVGFALEAGFLNETEAMHHESRHIVSNVIGAVDMRIEVGASLKLAARDTVLLASDGLFDNLHVDEIVSRLRKGPLKQGADGLVSSATKRMMQPVEGVPSKPDDLTLVAFRKAPPLRKRVKTKENHA